MGPLEAHRHRRSPSLDTRDCREGSYHKPSPIKIATEPLGALRPRGAAIRLGRRAMAWPPHLCGRWLGLLHARYACLTTGVWPAVGATAWVWLSRRPAPGAV